MLILYSVEDNDGFSFSVVFPLSYHVLCFSFWKISGRVFKGGKNRKVIDIAIVPLISDQEVEVTVSEILTNAWLVRNNVY